jgi:hypothetical protein
MVQSNRTLSSLEGYKGSLPLLWKDEARRNPGVVEVI